MKKEGLQILLSSAKKLKESGNSKLFNYYLNALKNKRAQEILTDEQKSEIAEL